jgi:hypothetical protein
MGQWMLNLLYIVRDPLQIESMSYEQMQWWNARAEKLIEAEKKALEIPGRG